MKIENETPTFESLEQGDVFRYCEVIYMKTSEDEKNAIRLNDGCLIEFLLDKTLVEPLPEAKVTLR